MSERVLVVDDNETGRYVTARQVSGFGYDVLEARTGHEALERAGEADLVLLDINLPDIDGFEVARRLRAAPETAAIPILHLTASSLDSASQVAGLDGGADAYLMKPLKADVLGATMRALLRTRRAEREAVEAASSWLATFEALSDAILVIGPDRVITRCNYAAAALAGLTPEVLVGQPAASVAAATGLPIAGPPGGASEATLGGRSYVHASHPIEAEDGSLGGTVEVLTDITDLRSKEEHLARAEARFEALVAAAPDAILAVGLTGRVAFANERAEELFGLAGPELVGRRAVELLRSPPDAESRVDIPAVIDPRRCDGSPVRLSAVRGSTTVPVEVRATAVVTNDGLLALAIARDMTEHEGYERRLRELAESDPLTGLYNRRGFETALARELAGAVRHGRPLSLALLDLDNFKHVNDTLGHGVGDEVISTVASTVRNRVRASDLCARLGGDELAVLMPDTDADGAYRLGVDLCEAIRADATVAVPGRAPVHVTASIGIAAVTGAMAAADLMVNADLALYATKDAGRDGVTVFAADQRRALRREVGWADRIRRALADGRVEIHAQPILDFAAGGVSMYELLARLRNEDGTIESAGDFIPAAERFGLIPDVQYAVLVEALDLAARLEVLGEKAGLAVNLCGHCLSNPLLLDTVPRLLSESGVSPERFTFEVTETSAIADMASAETFATRIREMGCSVALDDFGSGFGSYYYLKHLPADLIKIDGEFVLPLAHSERDRVLVRSMVEVARAFGVRTAVEMVEDEATLQIVKSLGVDYAQGSHIALPRPPGQIWPALSAVDARSA